MKSRLAEAEAEQERLSARPDEIAAQRHPCRQPRDSGRSRQRAADALAVAEQLLQKTERSEADAAAESREQQIRAEAREQAEETNRLSSSR